MLKIISEKLLFVKVFVKIYIFLFILALFNK